MTGYTLVFCEVGNLSIRRFPPPSLRVSSPGGTGVGEVVVSLFLPPPLLPGELAGRPPSFPHGPLKSLL